MAKFNLPSTVDESNLIEWDLFKNKNRDLTDTELTLLELEASEEVLNAALRSIDWNGFKTTGEITFIGYETISDVDGYGKTEEESYIDWITEWKEKERKFKRLFPLPTLSQTQYDALLSLYVFTGEFNVVGTTKRRFDISEFILNRQWDHVATAMMLSGYQRGRRKQEAKIMMLADYGKMVDRSYLKEEGLQRIRTMYPDRLDTKQQQQAEFVYYSETRRFLPKMTQIRKREIVKLYNNTK